MKKNISIENFKDRDLAIIVNDVEYEVPQRTQNIQDKLISIEKEKGLTEFKRYTEIVKAILGEKNCSKIFENGKNENLDFMAMVSIALLEVYNTTKEEINTTAIDETLDKIKPVLKAIETVEKTNALRK